MLKELNLEGVVKCEKENGDEAKIVYERGKKDYKRKKRLGKNFFRKLEERCPRY